MGKLMKDELFEAQLLRAMGYAPYGAADMGECLATAGRISGTELDQLARRMVQHRQSRPRDCREHRGGRPHGERS